MITAVDSNVLIDVFLADKKFGATSAKALQGCLQAGAVIISGVVFVEVMPLFPSASDFHDALKALNIQVAAIGMPSFLTAAAAWTEYRRLGGSKNRVVADFLIGAHAQVECERLLTRDRGFYRKYFKKLNIFEPGR